MAVTGALTDSYELGPIRPPSEAYSLLIRVTRNCPWNRCKFCPIYKGTKFQLRPFEEVRRDIDTAKAIYDEITALAGNSCGGDIRRAAAMVYNSASAAASRNVALWLYAGGKSAFLQDANTLIMKTPDLIRVLKYLGETFPGIDRITTYARSKTASQKTLAELKELHAAGLSRIHMGVESGSDAVLAFLDKGVTAADHIAGGKNVVASGISLCTYVMPGAGGKKLWREHALETARVLNAIDPAFIRLRTLTIQPRMLLYQDVVSGAFVRLTDEEIVAEIKLMVENLDCGAEVVSDHMMNLLPEIEGRMPEDKAKILSVIERFQSLPPEEREIYKLGRRLGLYEKIDDLKDAARRGEVERVMAGIDRDKAGALDEVLFNLMERYV
jgi:histone acetyltransferase (RNA polymerase elongator complex component)